MSVIKKMRTKHKRDITRPNFKPDPSPATRKRTKFGQIPGIEPGTTFESRRACVEAGVHGVPRQGIHSSPTGAYSVCLSGKYEDDKDDGDIFVYTGSGGKVDASSNSSEHVEDQLFSNPYNKSLKVSMDSGKPVRVVRGPNKDSKWAPTTGYRYDGLYRVIKASVGRRSGRRICKFEFRRLPGQLALQGYVGPGTTLDTDSKV